MLIKQRIDRITNNFIFALMFAIKAEVIQKINERSSDLRSLRALALLPRQREKNSVWCSETDKVAHRNLYSKMTALFKFVQYSLNPHAIFTWRIETIQAFSCFWGLYSRFFFADLMFLQPISLHSRWFLAPSPLFCNTVCYQTLFAINNIDVHILSHYLSSR